MKKLVSLVLALALVLTVATAFAVNITISKDTDNVDPSAITYTYYKVFDATYSSNTTTDSTIAGTSGTQASTSGFSYTIPATSPLLTISGGTASIDGVSNITLTASADGSVYSVTYNGAMTEAAAKTLASALQTKINSLTDTQKAQLTSGNLTYNTNTTKYEATNLPAGYYLIESNFNTKLVLATSDIDITEKNTYPTDVKEFVNPSTDDSVQIGDIIPYKLTVNIPVGSNQQIVVTDTYEAGLTPQVVQTTDSTANYYSTTQTAGQVYVTAVSGDTAATATTENTAFTVSEPSSSTHTFTITLTAEQVTALAGKTIIFTYYAELNANAEVRDTATSTVTNDNTVSLKYGNDYDTAPSKVETTTQTISLTKYDGSDINNADSSDDKTPIAGAIFEIRIGTTAVKLVKVSDTVYRVATAGEIAAATVTSFTDETTAMTNGSVTTNVRTVADTIITVKGLDDDVQYTWVETHAPTGYNPVNNDTNVTPTKTGIVNSDIANNQGTVLPSTGGIGTTIFYILGGLLVVGAAVILVARRKAQD